MNKKYLNITEVSKLTNIKEHVIRYWDSIDPKTNKLRVDGISTKSKGGTRYFNRDNISKLEKLKSLLYDDGHQNYSLKIANKFLSSSKKIKNVNQNIQFEDKVSEIKNTQKIREILLNMRLLTK